MSKKPLVEVKNLSVSFPVSGGIMGRKVAEVKAVDGISFSIGRSEIVGLVGESGCGKTTVGRAMINILKYIAPDVEVDGEILYHFDGEDVDFNKLHPRRMRKYRSRVQMIFQDPYASLNPRMTVAQIVEEPIKIHLKLSPKERNERVLSLLEKVGLRKDHSGRFPHEFSGGQRQRVGIARALATNPDLIICDEPVSALDVSIQAQVINLMMDIQKEFDISFLFIAHDLSVVEHISDKIAVMYLGNLMEFGTASQVYHHPKHPYSQALLSAVPVPDPKQKNRNRIILKGDVPTPMNKPSGCSFRTRCPIAEDSCSEEVPKFELYAPNHWLACPIVKDN
ncbi:MAG: ATP-binding cassette domain-containing protein [Candidatus Marinimicrobia bacterium]|jgi:oligopeptide transport system ATP-binding protein|nr:ATP-binding cassette domain-containing protein [Candidatus Neomarinimicrobiota bacterium]MBT4371146.1 ATP-binding cassette domain-containing protein [Candidatus Neomarinimicrobiota bacterium]MBT4662733.1 ATP-binding cassette domain-containing protein [Candidatus Neomarinimicrobiota bacterium]MBT5224572.1 ATP-binding cassette domain-containing protein [Candidatus Neomarinimicrobiota bacterium]MBT5721083.1 ATP-binding cassette domain-containing protein [Candidatus Neomarinimicrobiota bacterium